jgi:hypothetical protein
MATTFLCEIHRSTGNGVHMFESLSYVLGNVTIRWRCIYSTAHIFSTQISCWWPHSEISSIKWIASASESSDSPLQNRAEVQYTAASGNSAIMYRTTPMWDTGIRKWRTSKLNMCSVGQSISFHIWSDFSAAKRKISAPDSNWHPVITVPSVLSLHLLSYPISII